MFGAGLGAALGLCCCFFWAVPLCSWGAPVAGKPPPVWAADPSCTTHTHTHTRTGIVMPGYKLLMYFCCGTLIKLLFQLVHCGAVNGARPSSPPPSFRCKSALCSFLIIALHPALGFQRHPGNHVCSGCNLDCTLFVITIATRYNFAVLFKFYEFQCVSHVPVESGACSCRAGKAWAGLSG